MAADRAALVALYNATDGPNWANNTNWLSDEPLGEWHGVQIGQAGRVVDLRLYENNLTGEIPEELGSLSSLNFLSLSRNLLTGEIPSSIGDLTSLRGLFLSENNLSGELPATLGNLSDLEWLQLHTNQLSGKIPENFGSLTNLKTLRLWDNQLSGEIPSSIGNLTRLEELDLPFNQLTGSIPSSIGNLTSLTHLNLAKNRLTGEIPSSIGNLASLEGLYFYSNQLTGEMLSWMGKLTSLKHLELTHNRLSGEIPSELAGLPNLELLMLSGNQWGGCIPLGIAVAEGSDILRLGIPFCAQAADGTSAASDREALVALYNVTDGPNWFNSTNWLSDRPLGDWYGVVVNEAGRVVVLELAGNDLSGELPEELGSLSSLRKLNLRFNELSGQIPSELGSLNLLRELDLHSNELSGEIPSELGSLAPLRELYLHSNSLSGQIPSELGSLTLLRELDLYSNSLSGEIPPQLGNLSSLKWLSLHDNQLRGSIPPEFGELAKVEWMYLSGNSLSGEIPDELGELPRLSRLLVAGGNQQTGCVPTGLRSVKYADLHELGLPYCGETDPITVEVPTNLQPPPPSLGLDPYYGKYLDAGGVAIVSSLRVPDQALLSARNTLNEMLSDRPDLLATMAELGIRVAIWDEHAVSSDLPEYKHDMRLDAKALGLFNGIVASTGVESVLCYDSMPEPGFDYLVHELAHAVQTAVEHQPGGDRLRGRLQAIYDDARPRWEWTSAGEIPEEFWAEMVASWFGLQNAKNYWHDVNSPR